MDGVKAKELENKLSGKLIGKWRIKDLLDNGKSAAVFQAICEQSNQQVAIKVFDDELIEKYGGGAQLKRIERELDLIGKSHKNMVQILDGGVDEHTSNHYLVMEFLNGQNLKQCLQKIPMQNIGSLVSQLASCCEYLESLDLVHRDIKPENIIIMEDYSCLKLLDFGVVRPFGKGDITDQQGVQSFVGTLQYSSPEFLLREEEDSLLGWRALTFYQIGAVMHDLIMRQEIFADSTQPYARLVNAVQHNTPTISNDAIPSYLIQTAKACLSKSPIVRTKVLNWQSFQPPSSFQNKLVDLRSRVSGRSTAFELQSEDKQTSVRNATLDSLLTQLKVKVRSIRQADQSAFPPVTVRQARKGVLWIRFEPSHTHQLNCHILIALKLEILDSATMAFELSASGQISVAKIEDFNAAWETIYTGLPGEDFDEAVERCVYVAMDQGQTLPNSGTLEIDFKEF